MKAWSLALLIPSLALADPVLIRLHAPGNPNPALFGYDTLCHVQRLDPNTGLWTGVCKYVGYRGVNQSAVVQWDDTGAGTFIQPCAAYLNQVGVPCPKQTLGPFEYMQAENPVGTDVVGVYVQGLDATGVTAVILSGGPLVSALITP